MKYIIKITDPTGYVYYIADGRPYYVQGEKYACITEDPLKAKKYTALSRAINAHANLAHSCVNVWDGKASFLSANEEQNQFTIKVD